ncbi:MAG: GNAT family N-acetyltransferase [Alphaproteobacteria bacterium]
MGEAVFAAGESATLGATGLPAVPAALAARGVALRLQTEADLDFARDVYVAYRWEEMAASGWPEEARMAFLQDQFRMQWRHYATQYDGAAFAIVEVGGERAGRLYLLATSASLHIIDIAFLPPWRNQGIGSGLIRAIQEQARADGRGVTINVEGSNPAQRLYQRLGFVHAEPASDEGVYRLLAWRSCGA